MKTREQKLARLSAQIDKAVAAGKDKGRAYERLIETYCKVTDEQ